MGALLTRSSRSARAHREAIQLPLFLLPDILDFFLSPANPDWLLALLWLRSTSSPRNTRTPGQGQRTHDVPMANSPSASHQRSWTCRQARHPVKPRRQVTRDGINANERCWPMPWPSGTPGQRLNEKDGPRGGSGRRTLLCPTDPCPVPWGSVPWLAMPIDALPQWAAGLP